MTKSQHTPAPWIVGHTFTPAPEGVSKELTSVYSDNGNRCIANMVALRGDFSEAEANARLMAAAPELLAQLTLAQAQIGAWAHEAGQRGSLGYYALMDGISAAIAKTGAA